MKLDQVLKHEARAKQNIYSIYNRTCRNRLPFSEYLHMRKELRFHPKLPRHSLSMLKGYSDALYEVIQNQKLHYGFMFQGKIDTYSNLPEEGKELVRQEKIEGKHYWIDETGMKTSDIFY